jgi:hypothetical protein
MSARLVCSCICCSVLCLPQTLDRVAHREVLSLLLWRVFSIWQICWEVKREGQDKAQRPGLGRVEVCRFGSSYSATTNRISGSIRRAMVMYASAKSQQPPWLLPRQGHLALGVPEL